MEYTKKNMFYIYATYILIFCIKYWSVNPVFDSLIMGDNRGISEHFRTEKILYTRNELLKYKNSKSFHIDAQYSIPKEIKKKRRGRRGGIRIRNSNRKNKPFVPSITFGNCRSLHPKIDELRANCKFLYQYREACCLALTETWLDDKISDSSIEIPGFTLVRSDRTSKSGKTRGGGVAVYIKEAWCNNITPKKQHCCPNLELLSVSLRPSYLPREFTNIVITVVYIPPSADKNLAANLVRDNISALQDEKPDSLQIILGDMNRCDLKVNGFTQQVTCETRNDDILDMLYCNVTGYKSSKAAPLGKSDHNMIHMTPVYKRKLKTCPPSEKSITSQTENTFDMLNACFDTTDWHIFSENAVNINDLTEVVTDYIKFNEEIHSEKKTIKVYGNDKPWITTSLRKKIVDKHSAFSQNSPDYASKKKEVDDAINEAKKEYKEKVEQHFKSNNMRDAWKGIRTLTGQDNSKKESPLLQSEGAADRLNSFYARFDNKDFSNEHQTLRESLEAKIKSLPRLVIEEDEIVKAINQIKTRKASGPDHISPLLLKRCLYSLLPIIKFIFQLSLDTCDLAPIWKLGEIIPVSKKPIALVDNDFRPVTLTSVLCKCLERIILAKIKPSILPHIDPHQFAYLPNRTTGDAINTLIEYVACHLDQCPSNYVRALFIDFSSAFNTMQPHLLINKLDKYNLHPSLQLWILNFLTNRSQYVKTSKGNSSPLTINTGAPQGCVLSAFLFIIYTNDMMKNDENSKAIKYADDTVILGLIRKLNEDPYFKTIDYSLDWCKENYLDLNVEKTKEMIFDFRKTPSEMKKVVIDGTEVSICSQYKYLGCFIQDDLKWKAQTDHQIKKCNKRKYLLRILNNLNVDPKILALYYNSMIVSVLTYVIDTWYSGCGADLTREIARVEKRCCKLIKKKYHKLILRPEIIHKSTALSTAKKILKDATHPLHHKLKYLPHGKRLNVPLCRTKRYKNTAIPSIINIFNQKQ